MSRVGLVLTALLLSSLGSSPLTGDCPTRDGPNCVDCWEGFSPGICTFGTGEPDCHMIDSAHDPEWDVWHGYCQNGPHDLGELAAGKCEMTHEYIGGSCYSDEDQEDVLTAAIDGLEEAATFGEASRTLRAFQELKGVWVEFNAGRNALQVLSEGGCNPVPGGQVIKHLPVSEDMAEMWRDVFLSQVS